MDRTGFDAPSTPAGSFDAAVSNTGKNAAKNQAAEPHQTPERALIDVVLESLGDDKAEDIVSINLEGKTAIADHMVVASGRSHRHVSAVADHLLRRMKEAGYGTARVEGLSQGDWVLMDGGDVIVHIFRPEVREFYKLEKMWSADVEAEHVAVN